MRKLLNQSVSNGQSLGSYLRNRPHLTLITHDVYDISGRVQAYDPTFFIVRNKPKETYEIHNIDNGRNTYCFTAKELDARVIETLRKTDTKVHGVHTLYDELELQNQKEEEQKKKDRRDVAEGLARETAGHMKKAFAHM